MKPLFFNLLNEGGSTFMYPNLIILIICIILIAIAFVKGDVTGKTTALIKHISLFSLAWGFFGLFMGLISAFDTISSMDSDIATPVFAGGLKIGLLSPSFGILIFLIARLGIIALTIKKK
ncbi:MAG: MotA/TolQ/ExbB proton channel family protein [Flavobacteriaceae bacterium]